MARGLRIGVVVSGALVEERVLRGGPVTLGSALRCTISIPLDGMPRAHELVTAAGELRLPPGMSGRVAIGDAAPIAAADGPIARGARMRLQLGELVLLVQDVALPLPAPRPRLPAEIRGTLADRIDPRLAVIVGASIALHVGVATWAWRADLATLPGLGERADAGYKPDEIDVQLPDHVERVDPTITPTIATRSPVKAPPSRPAVAAPVTPPPRALPPPAPLALADAQRMASILTADDGHSGSNGFGGMASRTPGADLGTQIADVRERHVEIGGNRTSRDGDRAAIGTRPRDAIADLGGLQAPADAPHRDEPKTRIHFAPVPGPTDDTTLTAALLLDKIQSAYLAGLQRCYQLGLGRDATLQGKIALELTVDEHGRVADPAAAGLSADVDGCIAHQMATWHFPIPRDKSGAPSEATFHISLALQRAN